jgi:hypothetical protein
MIVQAIQEVLDEPCATVRARISFDKKKGKTTSEAARPCPRNALHPPLSGASARIPGQEDHPPCTAGDEVVA